MAYNRDAYVIEVPEGWVKHETHMICVDFLQTDGSVISQVICGVFGKNNAEGGAANLNRWRDQTKFVQ